PRAAPLMACFMRTVAEPSALASRIVDSYSCPTRRGGGRIVGSYLTASRRTPTMRSIQHCTTGVALATAILLTACSDRSPNPAGPEAPAAALGNGFPEGAHDYRVNLIGVPKDKTADMENNNGRRTFRHLN